MSVHTSRQRNVYKCKCREWVQTFYVKVDVHVNGDVDTNIDVTCEMSQQCVNGDNDTQINIGTAASIDANAPDL